MSDAEDPALPASSALGTREYWESHYARELENYEECQDEGEIWFGRQAETRAVEYILKEAKEGCRILDLGCGNGHFLRRLRKARSTWKSLTGTDYSEQSIALCKRIEVEEKEEDDELKEIRYEVVDILSEDSINCLQEKYDIIHDKGTWDAISLSDDRSIRLDAYRSAIDRLLIEGGLFIIVSCNYTTDELRAFFESSSSLHYLHELPEAAVKRAQSFSFGGKTGATFHTAVFRRG